MASIRSKKPFLFVFMAPFCVDITQIYRRRIVRLDAIFKLNKHSFPTWALMAEDEQGHGWPIATAISSKASAEVIKQFLHVVKEKLESELGEAWAPYIMIDKDQAEHKAVTAIMQLPHPKDLVR